MPHFAASSLNVRPVHQSHRQRRYHRNSSWVNFIKKGILTSGRLRRRKEFRIYLPGAYCTPATGDNTGLATSLCLVETPSATSATPEMLSTELKRKPIGKQIKYFLYSQESWPSRQAAEGSAKNWDENLLVARTSPGQNMQGEQDRVGDFGDQMNVRTADTMLKPLSLLTLWPRNKAT